MRKVLIVDPSMLDRKRMRSVLEAAGHGVIETGSPAEAVEALGGLSPQTVGLVLSELEFPLSDAQGIDLLQWLLGQREWSETPLLFVTMRPPNALLIDLVEAGAHYLVGKPFSPEALLRRVTEALQQRELLQRGTEAGANLHDHIRREMKRSERTGRPFSVIHVRLIDQSGMRAVAALMSGLIGLLRESDLLCRMGDDRLLIILPETDKSGVAALQRRLLSTISTRPPVVSEGAERPLQVVLGSASYPEEAGAGTTLIALAGERCR